MYTVSQIVEVFLKCISYRYCLHVHTVLGFFKNAIAVIFDRAPFFGLYILVIGLTSPVDSDVGFSHAQKLTGISKGSMRFYGKKSCYISLPNESASLARMNLEQLFYNCPVSFQDVKQKARQKRCKSSSTRSQHSTMSSIRHIHVVISPSSSLPSCIIIIMRLYKHLRCSIHKELNNTR